MAEVHGPGLAGLVAASGLGILVLRRLGAPNPFVLGSLASTLLLTASGASWSGLPAWASPAAQLAIGVSLGSRFAPEFVRSAPRWLGAVALGTLVMLALTAGAAWVLSRWMMIHPATALLATGPGGIAEMAITAKVLQLGVPVVTAFQVVRYVAVLTLTPILFRRAVRASGTARAG
jgi:membrane AbrB-like protein